MLYRRLEAIFLGLMFGMLLLPSCAHVDAFVQDVKSCASEYDPTLAATEADVGEAIKVFLECAPSSAAELPACATEGLEALASSLGPDGDRFVACVVTKVENDPAASALVKKRAHAFTKMKAMSRATGP